MFNLSAATLIARLIVLVVAFTVHEFAHAWTANYFGDDTPRLQGRLTLNPLVHLDFMGSLLILISGFGWAKPVQINPHALRRRSEYAELWVSLAGPFSNLLLAILAAIPFRLGLASPFGTSGTLLPTFSQLLNEFIFLNLILLLFNLIPLYPLDGEKMAIFIFPPSLRNSLDRIRPYSSLILLGLIFVVPAVFRIDILSLVLGPPLRFLYQLLVV